MPAAPLTLTYDDLPPGSDIRREYHQGTILITVPAGSVPAPTLRAAAQGAIVSGTLISALLLLGFLGIFGYFIQLNRITGTALVWAATFFTIFCTAIVGLVVWVRYRVAAEALEHARRQNTVLALSPGRLVADTRGPYGHANIELPAERIAEIGLKRKWTRDRRGHLARLWQLVIQLTDGREVSLIPGRDPIELRFIIGTMKQVLGRLEAPPGGEKGGVGRNSNDE